MRKGMDKHLHDWPLPEAAAIAQSRELEDLIRQAIDGNGGAISFARFMKMALYEPGLGYYARARNLHAGARDYDIIVPEALLRGGSCATPRYQQAASNCCRENPVSLTIASMRTGPSR